MAGAADRIVELADSHDRLRITETGLEARLAGVRQFVGLLPEVFGWVTASCGGKVPYRELEKYCSALAATGFDSLLAQRMQRQLAEAR